MYVAVCDRERERKPKDMRRKPFALPSYSQFSHPMKTLRLDEVIRCGLRSIP